MANFTTLYSLFILFLLGLCWTGCSKKEEALKVTSYTSDMAGTFTAEARLFNDQPSGAGPDLEYCDDEWWEGTLIFELEEATTDTSGVYKVFTENILGDVVEDPTMGGYYNCYEASQTNPSSLPNGINGEGLLRVNDDNGALFWTGISQWGEIYNFTNVSVMDNVLHLIFENDYAENFEVIITRQDGSNWHPDLRDGDG
jgi:hypothetical protein